MKNEYQATVAKEYEMKLFARNHTEAYYMLRYMQERIEKEIAACATQIRSITVIRDNIRNFV